MEFLGNSYASYDNDGVFVRTLEGPIHASWGDYLIKGVAGEFYPCKPHIFRQTYEEYTENIQEETDRG